MAFIESQPMPIPTSTQMPLTYLLRTHQLTFSSRSTIVYSAPLDIDLFPNPRILHPACMSALLVRMEAGKVGLYKIFIGWPKTRLQGPYSSLPAVDTGAAANGRDREWRSIAENPSV